MGYPEVADHRLTPADISEQRFSNAGRGGRDGLDQDEVYSFLDRVSAEVETLLSERAWQHGELARLNGVDGVPGHIEVQAVNILSAAQRTADRVVATAQEQARALAADGRRRREEIMSDANGKASGILRSALDEAAREASRIASAAPIDAQRQFAYYQSLAQSIRAQLLAFQESLAASIRQWETEERYPAQPGPLMLPES
jgi:DivIVA domain-containing protein